ncbi:MAG: hypothetical protein DRI71_12130 [Bacteroidetes bacterium]|nr:MAG: hypothetical protein DRI71_12130 [Bacteroidota bacterium]
MKLTFSLIVILLAISSMLAQESLDLVTLSGRYGFPQKYDSAYQGKATETGGLFNAKLPIPLNKEQTTIWYNDLLYSPVSVSNSETMSAEIANPIKLHGFILQTGLVKKFSNGTALQILFVPRFMTDFENVNGKNWQFGGIGLFEKRYHEKLMMRFGLLYNQELFGPILTPLVHLDWKFAPKWSIVGMLPIYAKINYHASENLTMGFSHFGLTTTYRLGNVAYENDYIERSSIDLTLFLRQRIAGNIHIEGRFGYALSRKYEQYTEDQKLDLRVIIFNFGDNRVQKNTSFNDGPIANIRLVYNLPLTDKE